MNPYRPAYAVMTHLPKAIAALPVRGTVTVICISLAWATGSAHATEPTDCGHTLDVRFIESAPRDRFEFVNRSGDATQVIDATVDLTGSAGELVFDTVDGGAGVEVFQPFRIEEGAALLVDSTLPEDGGERIALAFEAFGPGERFVFSIDVDDRLPSSELGQIRVAGSEITGASLTVSLASADGESISHTAVFDAEARATIAGSSCAG